MSLGQVPELRDFYILNRIFGSNEIFSFSKILSEFPDLENSSNKKSCLGNFFRAKKKNLN